MFVSARRRLGRRQALWNGLTFPFIYALVVPLALLDVGVSVFQALAFRIYGIPRVARRAYVVIDRHHLPYLSRLEQAHCAYCGYANGVLGYAREVAARLEQYWCPIRHARRVPRPHHHYRHFLAYGEASRLHSRLASLRRQLHADGRV